MEIKELINKLQNQKARSKWQKGVIIYSVMLLEKIQEDHDQINDNITFKDLETLLLNGAESWKQYSYGGCALVYDEDIAQMLATPSELKRTCNGTKKPNPKEGWLDTQERALYQAFCKIWGIVKSACL